MKRKSLGSRDAWQFIRRLPVKVATYNPRANQVEVEATTKGRFKCLRFYLDANALEC